MKRNRWSLIGLVLVIVIGGCGGYWYWSGKKAKPLQAAYQTTQVRRGSLEVKISGTGNIESASRELLKSSASGTIAAVKVKQGDKVHKGQVLATFEQDASADNTAFQIRSKEINLKKQQLDLDTMMTQFKEAPDDDKRAELSISLQKQQLDIESTKADIESLRSEKTTLEPITAPIDGTLATFSIAKGDNIGGQGNSSSSLGEVVNYDRLQMVVGVDELDISKVKANQTASVLVEALPDQTFTGKVVDIAQEGTASNGVSTFNVTIALDNPDKLKVGMSAEASISTQQKSDALYLPVEAVQSFGNRYFVMVPSSDTSAGSPSGAQGIQRQRQTGGQSSQGAQSGQSSQSDQSGQRGGAGGSGSAGGAWRQNRLPAGLAQSGLKRVPVEVGIHNEDYIEIVSGLKEGEAVIVPSVTGSSGSSTQNRNGNAGIAGLGLGGGLGGGGFAGGNRQFGGSNRQSGGGGNRGGSGG